jgi:hypothetical protein
VLIVVKFDAFVLFCFVIIGDILQKVEVTIPASNSIKAVHKA